MRAVNHELEQREQSRNLEALQAAVAKGINSGEGLPAEEVFKKLSDKYRKMAGDIENLLKNDS